MRIDEYAGYDGLGLAALVKSGEVAPAELIEAALAAAEVANPALRAVVQTYPDAASSTPLGLDGPFAGVPTMLKDLFHGRAGWECGNGSRLCEGWIVPATDEFPHRLMTSGLVPVGRTTTSELGLLGTTETLAAGRTATPWSGDHMAGGSSGGSGAVVAAGIVPLATASDGGGSIRIPASACGVVGLKPSRGRVTWGLGTAEPLLGWAVRFMMTRSVRDSAAALDVLSRPFRGDPFHVQSPDRPFVAEIGAPVEPLRVAWWARPWSGHHTHEEVASATRRAADMLEALGHEVEEATPAIDWERFLAAMTDVWTATTAHSVDGFAHFLHRPVDESTLESPTLAMVRYGREVGGQRLLDALTTAADLRTVMAEFFSRYDVLLTPTLGALPAPLGEYDPHALTHPRDTFGGWAQLESFLPIINATGQPAISLPLYTSSTGLPIGMQLVGRLGEESLLLRLSASLEEAAPWSSRRPPLHVANLQPS